VAKQSAFGRLARYSIRPLESARISRGAEDVDELRSWSLLEELLHPFLDDHVAELAPHEQRQNADVPHRRLEERLEVLPGHLQPDSAGLPRLAL
jgi:hypothetical protein